MNSFSENEDDDEIEIHQGHGEPWLVSYADLMTLLFGFFVLMYSFAAKNRLDSDYVKVKKELAVYFGGNYADEFDTVGKAIGESLKQQLTAEGDFELKSGPDGLEIAMGTNSLFESGSASLKRKAVGSVTKMAELISSEFKNNIMIVVSGHSDDTPIGTRQFPSNWELSSARSASVVRIFEKEGISRNQLKVEGFADSMPILPNKDNQGRPIRENRARNRRVVINVYKIVKKK